MTRRLGASPSVGRSSPSTCAWASRRTLDARSARRARGARRPPRGLTSPSNSSRRTGAWWRFCAYLMRLETSGSGLTCARRTLTGVAIEAPREGRAKPRINWLLRQLADAPADLRVEAAFPNARQTTSVLLADAREEPDKLLYPADAKREPRAFT